MRERGINMKISVIIPSYKPQEYIFECLTSLQGQTLSNKQFEVLIILNGEKEPYYSKIDNYIKKNNLFNFILLYTKEKGVSNARNIGLKKSQGENIAFIDDDDYISSNYLEEMLKKINYNTIVICNIFRFYDNTDTFISDSEFIENNTVNNILKGKKYFSMACCKLIPKVILKNVFFKTNLKNSEDTIFMMEISKNIKLIKTTPANIIYYRRIRENSAYFRKKTKQEIIGNFFQQLFYLFLFLINKEYNKKFITVKILGLIKGTLKILVVGQEKL